MRTSILLLICALFCTQSTSFAQSPGLHWNEPDSLVFFKPGVEQVLRFTVSNKGSKTETADVRLEGDTADWKLIATARGYSDDIVMMPSEVIWVDVKFTAPFKTASSAKLIADGSLTDDTLYLSASSNTQLLAWDPGKVEFVVSEYSTDTLITVKLVNLWYGPVTVQDFVLEGDPAWTESTPLPMIVWQNEYREIAIHYAPTEPGVHIGRLITVTEGASDTLFLKGRTSRTVKGVYWGSDTMRFIPQSCTGSSSHLVELNNDGSSDAQIESVSTEGSDAGYFRILSSVPPNKFQDFILAPSTPGNGVQYLVEFRPDGSKQPRTADLVAHTSSGGIHSAKLIGLVPASDVIDIDTTLTRLQVGVDHVIMLKLNNIGNATYNTNSAYWSGDLDATVNDLSGGIQIMPGIGKDITVTLRSDVVANKSALIHFNGNDCDDPFEMRINAQFTDQSSVGSTHESDIQISQDGEAIRVTHSEPHPLAYRILDASGRAVLSGSVSQRGTVDISTLSSGAYFFTIEAEDQHTLKFIHQ